MRAPGGQASIRAFCKPMGHVWFSSVPDWQARQSAADGIEARTSSDALLALARALSGGASFGRAAAALGGQLQPARQAAGLGDLGGLGAAWVRRLRRCRSALRSIPPSPARSALSELVVPWVGVGGVPPPSLRARNASTNRRYFSPSLCA